MPLLPDCREYCIKNNLLSCQVMLVGVSGGADSMCLLDILFSLSGTWQDDSDGRPFPKIIAAHVNHGLRGAAADEDEELVRSYCSARGIAFASYTADVALLAAEKRIGLEEAGRIVRYSFFEETARKYSAGGHKVFTAVAHHREDQAETILMNLFRGTGPDGLTGMQPCSRGIVRPLLFASKKDILGYMKEKGLCFSEDYSNLDNTYTRNCWRNRIFPLIEEACGKDPVQPLLAMSDLLRTDQSYFEEIVGDIFAANRISGGNNMPGLPCPVITGAHRAVASRLVRHLYAAAFSSAADLGSVHVSAVLSLTEDPAGGRLLSLPHGRTAYIADGVLFFDNADAIRGGGLKSWDTNGVRLLLCSAADAGETPLFSDVKKTELCVPISKTSFELETILVENPEQVVYNSRTWYCTPDVLGGAVLRTRRQGDWFSHAGSVGGKLLRRYLTDRKIPAFVRDRMLIAANGAQVLWIPGLAHAAGFVDEASRLRFFASRGRGTDPISLQDMQLYRITIRNMYEQEEQ